MLNSGKRARFESDSALQNPWHQKHWRFDSSPDDIWFCKNHWCVETRVINTGRSQLQIFVVNMAMSISAVVVVDIVGITMMMIILQTICWIQKKKKIRKKFFKRYFQKLISMIWFMLSNDLFNAVVAKWFIRAKLKISSVKSGEGSTPSYGTI